MTYCKYFNGWSNLIDEGLLNRIVSIVYKLYQSSKVYPEYKSIFKAFNLCNYANVSVVILGYDPYFDGSATGLSFDSAKNCNTLSPALKVIKNSFQSYEDWEELGNFEPDLEKWAKHIDDLKNREQELISNLFCNEFQPLSDFNRQNELVAELKALGFNSADLLNHNKLN